MKPAAWCWEANANGEAPSIKAVDASERGGVDLTTRLAQLMPHGVFTTARGALLDGHLQLSQHDEHISRLAGSLRGKSGGGDFEYEAIFGRAFGEFITATVDPFLSSSTDAKSFTVLLMVEQASPTSFKMGFAMKAYEPAAIPQSCSIAAVTVEAGRQRPDIKSNEWIEQRRRYEALKTEYACNEVLMVKEDGCCVEGLSSNFGVLLRVEGRLTLKTASTKYVLDGTTLRVVKEQARLLGIAVDDESEGPNIGDLAKWEAAFICSTSRLLLPVTAIIVDGKERRIDSLASEKLLVLRKAIADHLLHN